MIALDTNVLVYAHRVETDQHEAALTEGVGFRRFPAMQIRRPSSR